MNFTIGGIRDIRSGSWRRGRTGECTAAAEFTGLWGWDVVPGARATANGCSCGRPPVAPGSAPGPPGACRAPGAHPLATAPVVPAGATLDEVTRVWAGFPHATLMLPVGRTFDVLEVGETAGRRALVRLERMGLPLGPVVATPQGRAQFLVAPGAAVGLPRLLYRMGWDGAALDLRALGPGDHITAPPSDRGGLGPVRWLRTPCWRTAGPPEARLVLGVLGHAAHRSRR
ncbi:bifunctional DNA primase/polymerase [Streptomyces sp. NPDC002490]|uniref:bifunctional DNA primase/polymerase n=1 Tax=Streptomyces sp. NPDC002490 TaxID=3154416 RepID=UPI00332CD928